MNELLSQIDKAYNLLQELNGLPPTKTNTANLLFAYVALEKCYEYIKNHPDEKKKGKEVENVSA